ncbi:MAG TPA: DUF3618 domain-containing protein [Solirubrobacteraceae bacterium]|nr:DUF3618 domain-containing protein [Solirubrobacteraceae bacterium]
MDLQAITPSNQRTDPEQLRREIEAIRRELGETVAQLAQKADVKTTALRHTPDSAQQAATGARRHPLALAVAGALAVGFLVGRRVGRRA